MRSTVVGLGKIGLPLAVQMASKGHTVLGADIQDRVVSQVNAGVPPFPGEPDLEERLVEAVRAGSLHATTDTAEAVSRSDHAVVVVPLVVDEQQQPDFRGIDAATRDVARGLQPGTLVSFETTLPVGTTRDRFTPLLEEVSGLRAESDFFVCHSPERVSSGHVFADLRRYPKLVGGIDEESAKRAVAYYESFLDFDPRPDLHRENGVWDLGSAEAAELTKLAETTYRDVNIGLANEFARFAERSGLDVHAVIDAANSQPYSHIHRPGIAVGGHCIPVYPRFYLSNDPDATLPAAARIANDDMPRHAVERLGAALGGLTGKRVAVLGLAYRGGVKESAFSGAFPLVRLLGEAGATALVQDPLYTDEEIEGFGLTPYHWGEPCDGAMVQADHQDYLRLGPEQLPGLTAILDGRRHLPADRWTDVALLVLGAAGSSAGA